MSNVGIVNDIKRYFVLSSWYFKKLAYLFNYKLLELGACHVPQGAKRCEERSNQNFNTSQYRSVVTLKLDLPAKDR